jgi:hypothetical protein
MVTPGLRQVKGDGAPIGLFRSSWRSGPVQSHAALVAPRALFRALTLFLHGRQAGGG